MIRWQRGAAARRPRGPRARRDDPIFPRAGRSSGRRRGRSGSSRASHTCPIPPEPSGRIGRYRPRKRSWDSAGEDTLGSYGLSGANPSPTGHQGRFWLGGPARRRPPLRFLRGRARDHGVATAAHALAAPRRSRHRDGRRRRRAAARLDTCPAPARAARDRRCAARLLRPAAAVVRVDVEALRCQELLRQGRSHRQAARRTTAPPLRTR